MNQEIISTLNERNIILSNLDSLIKHGNDSKKNKNQLSLFGGQESFKPKLSEPENTNYQDLLDKEKDTLGVCLTYNIFDRHILLVKRFCNNTVRSLNEMTESKQSGIVLIAQITDFKFKKSKAGNNYAKITIQDHNSSAEAYIWGDIYKKHISSLFKGQIYLIELGYNKDNESVFILNIKDVRDIDPKDYVSKIILHLNNFRDAVLVRPYTFKMWGSDYALDFNYNGQIINAPYRINMTEEHFSYLKQHITDIEVEKKDG